MLSSFARVLGQELHICSCTLVQAPIPKPPAVGLVRKALAQGSGVGLPVAGGADSGSAPGGYMRSNAGALRIISAPESKASVAC